MTGTTRVLMARADGSMTTDGRRVERALPTRGAIRLGSLVFFDDRALENAVRSVAEDPDLSDCDAEALLRELQGSEVLRPVPRTLPDGAPGTLTVDLVHPVDFADMSAFDVADALGSPFGWSDGGRLSPILSAAANVSDDGRLSFGPRFGSESERAEAIEAAVSCRDLTDAACEALLEHLRAGVILASG